VLIIAFGESILAAGIQYTPYAFQRDRTVALIVSFTITALMAHLYVYQAGAQLSAAITATNTPAYTGELASYIHLTMFAGIIISAVGDKLVIAHPTGHDGFAWILAITGGPALFLAGRDALGYATFSVLLWHWPIGIVLLAIAVPATRHLPAIGVAAVTATVLAGMAITSWIIWRRNPYQPLTPTAPGGRHPR
jgi:low temperature requirement protein LtrA